MNDARQVRSVGQIAIVKGELGIGLVRILVDVINALGIKGGGPALDSVNLVSLAEQEFSEIGAVLAGNACYRTFAAGGSILFL